jgi:hypothetical protein
MQSYCVDQEREAVATLEASTPPLGMVGEDFLKIRDHCATKWPDNYHMRVYCENQQVEGWQKMH